MKPAAVFTLTGLGFFVYWLVANPSFEGSPTQGEWPHVLAFSRRAHHAGHMVGGRGARPRTDTQTSGGRSVIVLARPSRFGRGVKSPSPTVTSADRGRSDSLI